MSPSRNQNSRIQKWIMDYQKPLFTQKFFKEVVQFIVRFTGDNFQFHNFALL